MRKHVGTRIAALLLCAALCGCTAEQAPAEASFFAMDTLIQISAYGRGAQEALADCRAEMTRLERLLSVAEEGSDIARINASGGAGTGISAETAALLSRAKALSAETGGAFDPTVYPLVRLWGFLDGEHRVPEEAEIDALLPLVDAGAMTIEGGRLSLPDGAGVDLGGIAKGYASDRLAELLAEQGIRSAKLSLGGNVRVIGPKPDGSDWRIGIMDPFDETQIIGYVRAQDTTIVSAGGYQRWFEQDGVRYHHILDPKTGRPAESGLASVTVILEDGTAADALSTALYVMGLSEALALQKRNPTFEAVFVTTDREIYCTKNITLYLSKDWEHADIHVAKQ